MASTPACPLPGDSGHCRSPLASVSQSEEWEQRRTIFAAPSPAFCSVPQPPGRLEGEEERDRNTDTGGSMCELRCHLPVGLQTVLNKHCGADKPAGSKGESSFGWGLPELSRGDLYLRPLDFSPTLVPPLCLFQVPFPGTWYRDSAPRAAHANPRGISVT